MFQCTKNSVWYLGLIALGKLLSPSHAQESISLYKDYKLFLKKESTSDESTAELSSMLLKRGFKGFVSNRFGRIGELSTAFTEHKSLLNKYFELQVDEHSNKLVLAISCYMDSHWFRTCCEVSKFFFDILTQPLKSVLGIDEFKKSKHSERSWKSTKDFYSSKMEELDPIPIATLDSAIS